LINAHCGSNALRLPLLGASIAARIALRAVGHHALVALSCHTATSQVQLIVLIAAVSGIFQAGIDLVFFDELMKTVPPAHTATFVSMAQMLTYLSTMLAPLLGTLLADRIGLAGALVFAAAVRLLGFLLFAIPTRAAEPVMSGEPAR
jgi:predicted MFS family arabinose efflux permease